MNNEKENFGVPRVDNSPMGIIGMEGYFFRGLSNKTPRSLGLRIAIILFSLVFFLIPGICLTVFAGLQLMVPTSGEQYSAIIPVVSGLLLTCAGIAGIKANLKNKK